MTKVKPRRPSAAMIVAAIALSLALGGSAVAASELTKSQVKKIAKKQAKQQIKKQAPKLHVGSADSAAPAAYARVIGGTADVDEANSKNVQASDLVFDGTVFCFYDLDFKPRHVQATVDWVGGGGDTVIHASVGNSGSCDGVEDAAARMVDASTGTAVTVDFYISFDD